MDTSTLRIAFAVLALTMLVLFYLITYRSTRSEFCGWWCVSLAMFLAGSSAFLLDGTAHQVWGNPLGNVLIVLGGVSVWNGARSLRAPIAPWWLLSTAPVVVLVASVVDHPATNDWSGGPVFLAAMALTVGAASVELARLHRETVPDDLEDHAVYLTVVRAMAVTSAGFALFYVGRCVAFLAVGPDAPPFSTVFDSGITTLLTSVLLATVSFSMSSLSHEQRTGDLRRRASTDGLTGLLNRTAFAAHAATELQHARRRSLPACVLVADVDHFKAINDGRGHHAGDAALRAVAACCRAAVRDDDVVGRLGGDEFVLLLPGATTTRASEVAAAVREGLVEHHLTMSFGIAAVDVTVGLDDALVRADAALYRAKKAGRDRAVCDDGRPARPDTLARPAS